MVNFTTKWKTPSSKLADLTEGETWSNALVAVQEYVFMGETDQTYIDTGTPNVNAVYKNGQLLTYSTDYTLAGNVVQFSNSLETTDLMVLETSVDIKYTLQNNALPDGLFLGQNGVISGTLGSLSQTSDASDIVYKFTVRATDGTTSSDRLFSINAIHTTVATNPPGWGDLPLAVNYNGLFNYIPLGRTTKDVNFVYNIDLYTPGGLLPVLVLNPIDDVDSPYNKIPKGLTVHNDGTVIGLVDSTNPTGQYFFELTMLNNNNDPITTGSGQFPKIFMIEISAPTTVLQPLRFIKWQTPAGSLGNLPELQPCPMSVFATCTTGEAIQYTIKAGTQLPPGFLIDKYTGYIMGVAEHVAANTTYTFTIRATVASTDIYSDRNFSITVISKFNTYATVGVFLNLCAKDYIPLSNYYSGIINDSYYFRTNDSNYLPVNQKNNMAMLVIGGLSSNINNISSLLKQSNYKAPISILLGHHKVAKAKIDGKVVYEVIYREVIDLQEGAGSYSVLHGYPQSDPVIYPQNRNKTVYPMSIDNLRYYLLLSAKFATGDTNLQTYVGDGSIEDLPLWMTSIQDDGTVLGYTKAFEIASVKPGTGQTIIDTINSRQTINTAKDDLPSSINENHRSDFDQVFVQLVAISAATSFDAQSNPSGPDTNHNGLPDDFCTFDTSTSFDEFSQYDGQLIRIYMDKY